MKQTAFIVYATKDYQHTLLDGSATFTIKALQSVDISNDDRYIRTACKMYQERGYPVVVGRKTV
jgi:hypothetical protein